MSEPVEGFVQNLKNINETAFSFDLQGETSSQRIVCFSPQKRKIVEEKMKSPVKLNKIRKSTKGTDIIFTEESTVEDVDLDFKAIDYEDITLDKLKMYATGSLFNVEVKVMSKQKPKFVKGKVIQTFAVSDEYGAAKFTSWEGSAGELSVGSVYKLINVKVKTDCYGSIELVTPQKGFEIKKSRKIINTKTIDPAFIGIKGEIMSVDDVKKYRLCITCHKKVVTIPDNNSVTCEACGNVMKKRFCDIGMYAKFLLFTEDKKKISLTMFQEEIKSLVQNAESMTEEQIKVALVDIDDPITITKSSTNVVASITM